MQRPTNSLRVEHAVAAQGLEALSAVARHVQAGGSFPTTDVATLLRFLREFLVAIHMRKETEIVWPALAMRGDEATAARVGELFRMHDEVTELVHSLILFWEPIDDLSSEERQGFVDTVDALTTRVRRMQQIEEHWLFAACDAAIPADDQIEWGHRFREAATNRDGIDVWEPRIAKLARAWIG